MATGNENDNLSLSDVLAEFDIELAELFLSSMTSSLPTIGQNTISGSRSITVNKIKALSVDFYAQYWLNLLQYTVVCVRNCG